MLYFLSQTAEFLPVFNLFRYITVRTGGAMMTAMLLVFLFGPLIINWLRTRSSESRLVEL